MKLKFEYSYPIRGQLHSARRSFPQADLADIFSVAGDLIGAIFKENTSWTLEIGMNADDEENRD